MPMLSQLAGLCVGKRGRLGNCTIIIIIISFTSASLDSGCTCNYEQCGFPAIVDLQDSSCSSICQVFKSVDEPNLT